MIQCICLALFFSMLMSRKEDAPEETLSDQMDYRGFFSED